uniref:Uncharacterized protein n=1 Tax=Physcomitrium patens TaxID=3218 RepID=A0A2K1JVD9_PHYPA|nr:hypothetical protein PHYPA_015263 [Physcomitrium patens]
MTSGILKMLGKGSRDEVVLARKRGQQMLESMCVHAEAPAHVKITVETVHSIIFTCLPPSILLLRVNFPTPCPSPTSTA